jgi:hypothetical protein
MQVIPDLRHVPDPVTIELHRVHVVGCDGLARRRVYRPWAGLGSVEHSEGCDHRATFIGREGFQLVVAVRERHWSEPVEVFSGGQRFVVPVSPFESATDTAGQVGPDGAVIAGLRSCSTDQVTMIVRVASR